jgi:hypothetical protein
MDLLLRMQMGKSTHPTTPDGSKGGRGKRLIESTSISWWMAAGLLTERPTAVIAVARRQSVTKTFKVHISYYPLREIWSLKVRRLIHSATAFMSHIHLSMAYRKPESSFVVLRRLCPT